MPEHIIGLMHQVYVLYAEDEGPDVVRYVGRSIVPTITYSNVSKIRAVEEWIADVEGRGSHVIMEIVASTPDEDEANREVMRRKLSAMDDGAELLNQR